MLTAALNVTAAARSLQKAWDPVCLAAVNNCLVKIARFEGEYVWHEHAAEDECFLVLEGQMILHVADRTIIMNQGDLFVVPRGVQHLPTAPNYALVLIMVPESQINTGNITCDLTKKDHTWFDARVPVDPTDRPS